MLRSMTGFGRCFLEEDNWTQVWEVRSVNGKHLDIRWRLPVEARPFEGMLEKLVKTKASRGRMEISLHLQRGSTQDNLMVFNGDRAEAMLESLEAFASARGEEFVPDYNRLLQMGSLWEDTLDDADEEFGELLRQGLGSALEDWDESRVAEGSALEQDILKRLLRMEEWVARIHERAPDIKEDRLRLIRERLVETLDSLGQDLDDSRFLQEAVLLADRMDVSEELTRLDAHFVRVRELIGQGADAGRKLDFTLQECFREINTCGNKIQDIQVSRLVVDLKNELEKCREQVQNIE